MSQTTAFRPIKLKPVMSEEAILHVTSLQEKANMQPQLDCFGLVLALQLMDIRNLSNCFL